MPAIGRQLFLFLLLLMFKLHYFYFPANIELKNITFFFLDLVRYGFASGPGVTVLAKHTEDCASAYNTDRAALWKSPSQYH